MEIALDDSRANQRNRTRMALLQAANDLLAQGKTPTVPEAAEAAAVSRATAYRYFPSQSSLLIAAVSEVSNPIAGDTPVPEPVSAEDAAEKGAAAMVDLFTRNEAQFRTLLRLSLEQWAGRRAGEAPAEDPIRRGGRIPGIEHSLRSTPDLDLDADTFRKVAIALSVVFGIEAWVVLKDIWHLDNDEAEEVLSFMGKAILRAAQQK